MHVPSLSSSEPVRADGLRSTVETTSSLVSQVHDAISDAEIVFASVLRQNPKVESKPGAIPVAVPQGSDLRQAVEKTNDSLRGILRRLSDLRDSADL